MNGPQWAQPVALEGVLVKQAMSIEPEVAEIPGSNNLDQPLATFEPINHVLQ